MKFHTLPVKRRPVSKGIFRRLSAVTRNRKQRVAAAGPAGELEMEDGSAKISRALTIIFLIHIVAIGLIFFHQKFLETRVGDVGDTPDGATAEVVAAVPVAPREPLPRLSNGERAYVVQPGDNYARIAAIEGVDEGDLRMLNDDVAIRPSVILKIPPKRIVAEDPPEVVAIRQQIPSDRDRGLVEAIDVSNAPRAQLVRPGTEGGGSSTTVSTVSRGNGKSYVVQPGDSIWRIANRFNVKQEELMRANNITDPRKMKTGATLVIPEG